MRYTAVTKTAHINRIALYHNQTFCILNTKIVLPPFYFHGTDKPTNITEPRVSYVPGEMRVNYEQIPNLVSMDDYYKFCGRSATGILLAAADYKSTVIRGRIVDEFTKITKIGLIKKNVRKYEFLDSLTFYPDLNVLKNITSTVNKGGMNRDQQQYSISSGKYESLRRTVHLMRGSHRNTHPSIISGQYASIYRTSPVY